MYTYNRREEPNYQHTIYNYMRIVRKWRVINCLVIVVCFCLLLRTLNSINLTRERPKEIPQEAKNLVTTEEAETILKKDHEDFIRRQKSSIPKIIHQIYRNGSIPLAYSEMVKSWIKNHPDYEYWFWDDDSGRKFIETYYREFLLLYDSYCHDLFRSDALRYFILNEFGGLYIDMDYQSVKNLDNVIQNKSCAFVQEHQYQAMLLYNSNDMIMNAWMAAVPYHPFMNFLINNLPSNADCKFDSVLKSTGPLFVHNMKKKYYEITKCNTDDCAISVLPSTQMMPEFDDNKKSVQYLKNLCRRRSRLREAQRNACDFFIEVHFMKPVTFGPEVYASHRFLHIGNEAKLYRDKDGYVDIKELVPKVIFPMDNSTDKVLLPTPPPQKQQHEQQQLPTTSSPSS